MGKKKYCKDCHHKKSWHDARKGCTVIYYPGTTKEQMCHCAGYR